MPFSVGFERLEVDRPELVCAFACSSAVTSFANGIVQQPNLEVIQLFAHAFCPFPFESAADSAAFFRCFERGIVCSSQFRFLQKAELHLSAFEFDYRVAEGAEGGLYVAHEFVDAPGVLAAGHSGIAAGDAFDEVHERFLDLAGIVDCRRAFRAGEVVFEELEETSAFGYEDVGVGAERTARNRLCRRREIFEQTVRVVRLAVEDAADALFARRHFGFAPVCREDFHEQIVEPCVAFDYRLDGFRKSRFLFFSPISLSFRFTPDRKGRNGYAPTGRQCVIVVKITLLLRRI